MTGPGGQQTRLEAVQERHESGFLPGILAHEWVVHPEGREYLEVLELSDCAVECADSFVEIIAGK
jgi:hypothetical protein